MAGQAVALGLGAIAALGAPIASTSAQPDGAPAKAVPPAFPHPLITEVLYAVPTGVAGDANRDGARHANGDEFVELTNPHDKPIQLLGYTLADRNVTPDRRIRFTFPAFELPPGGVVVVFNGFEASMDGPVGSAEVAPKERHPKFDGAWVFSMGIKTPQTGLSNTGDYLLLTSPTGEKIHLIRWGEFPEAIPEGCVIVEGAPLVAGQSAHRVKPAGPLVAHDPREGKDGLRYSPGFTGLASPVGPTSPSTPPSPPPK